MKRISLLSAVFAGLLLPCAALAQGEIFVVCTGLAGCGGKGELFTHAVTAILAVLVTIAAGISLVFVVWGGIQLLTLWGDDGKAAEAKNTIKHALIGLAVTMCSGSAVGFVATEFYGGPSNVPMIALMEGTIRIFVTLSNVLFLIAVVYAGYLMAMGKEDYGKGVSMVRYAIAGAIVVNLARAIVDGFLGLIF